MQAPGVTAPNGLCWHCPSGYLQRSASQIPGGGAAEGQTPRHQPRGAALKPPKIPNACCNHTTNTIRT